MFIKTNFLFSAITPKKGTVFRKVGNLRRHKVAQNPPHNPQRKTPVLGRFTKKNRFQVVKEMVPKYEMPDLEGIEYKPYVSRVLHRTFKKKE